MSDNGCNPSRNSRRDRNRPASTLTRSCRRSVQRRPTQTTEARWFSLPRRYLSCSFSGRYCRRERFPSVSVNETRQRAAGARPQVEPEPVIACTRSARHSNFSRSPHAENRHIVCRCSWTILAAQFLLGGLVKPDHFSDIQLILRLDHCQLAVFFGVLWEFAVRQHIHCALRSEEHTSELQS